MIVFTSLLMSLDNTYSQERSIYENYYLFPSFVNAAFTGAENYPVAELSVKRQWQDFPSAPSTFFLAGNVRIGKYDFYTPKGMVNKGPLKTENRVGIGANIYCDRNGPLSNTGLSLSYAYHLPVNLATNLSFGLSINGSIYSLNTSELKPNQSNDSYLFNGKNTSFRFNSNVGLLYYNNTYFIGLSANKLFPDELNLNSSIEEKPSYFLIGGYKFRIRSEMLYLEPSAALKKIADEKINLDLHTKLVWKLNWVALSYSSTKNMKFLVGLNIYKRLYAGYSYEYTVSNISSYTSGSHEIYLGINLGLTGVSGIRRTINNQMEPILN